MALVIKDRVQVQSSTTGTATFTLGAAVGQCTDFSAVGANNTTYYTALDGNNIGWEVGFGTITLSGTIYSLSRDTIYASSNANAKITLTANTHLVFDDMPASVLSTMLSASAVVQGGAFLNAGTIGLGGTIANSATPTAHSVLIGAGASAVTNTGTWAAGQFLVGQAGSLDPLVKTLTGDVSVSATGSVTVNSIGGGIGALTAADHGLAINSGTVQSNLTATFTGTAAGTLTISPVTGTTDILLNMPASGGTVTVTSVPSFSRQRMMWDVKQGATAGVLNLGTVFKMTGGITGFTLTGTANAIDRIEWMSPDGTSWVPLALNQGFTL